MSGPAKPNNPAIPSIVPNSADLAILANPVTGNIFTTPLGTVIAMIAASANSPIKTYTTRAAMLANLDIPANYFAFVTNNGGGWALYFYVGGDRSSLGSYQYLIGETKDTDNHWVDCGVFDTDSYPAEPGSGYGGEILRGNTFDAGDSGTGPDGAEGITISTVFYPKGTTFRALVDNPGSTPGNWRIHS